MRTFHDEHGREWIATVKEEATARHHGRWYLVLRAADGDGPDAGAELPVAEIRWQTEASARRTIRTMAEFELRKRLAGALRRVGAPRARTAPGART